MKDFDDYLNKQLHNEEEVTAYINAALDEYYIDHNKALLLATLKEVIDNKGGVSVIAHDACISRQHIYRMLSSKGNPTFDNFSSLLMALGFKLKVEHR